MKYFRSKILGLFMMGMLSFVLLPATSYANSCEDGKEECMNECNEVFDGDSDIVEIGRAICKGGCHIAKLVCDYF